MVPEAEKCNCKLVVKRHLVLWSIVHEDGVIFNPCDKFIEHLRIDTQILSELFVIILLIQDQNKI